MGQGTQCVGSDEIDAQRQRRAALQEAYLQLTQASSKHRPRLGRRPGEINQLRHKVHCSRSRVTSAQRPQAGHHIRDVAGSAGLDHMQMIDQHCFQQPLSEDAHLGQIHRLREILVQRVLVPHPSLGHVIGEDGARQRHERRGRVGCVSRGRQHHTRLLRLFLLDFDGRRSLVSRQNQVFTNV